MKSIQFVVCFYLMSIASAALAVDEPITRNYPIPGHGELQLSAPKSWQDQLRQPANSLPPTIVFTPKPEHHLLSSSQPCILSARDFPYRQHLNYEKV